MSLLALLVSLLASLVSVFASLVSVPHTNMQALKK